MLDAQPLAHGASEHSLVCQSLQQPHDFAHDDYNMESLLDDCRHRAGSIAHDQK